MTSSRRPLTNSSTAASLGLTPVGEPAVSIAVCYCGPIEEGEQVLRSLRTFQTAVDDTIRLMPYTGWQEALVTRGSPPVNCTTGSPAGYAT